MLKRFAAGLALKVLYDAFLAGSVPQGELFGFWKQAVNTPEGPITVNRISVDYDDVAIAGLIALGLSTMESYAAKVVPKA